MTRVVPIAPLAKKYLLTLGSIKLNPMARETTHRSTAKEDPPFCHLYQLQSEQCFCNTQQPKA
jgi:hypothetical protein